MATTFLRLFDGVTSISLNVVADSFREEPPKFQGNRRPANDGTMLSTERDPHRSFTMDVDFLTVALYDAFLVFVSSGTDVFTGRLTGLRSVLMGSLGGDGALRVSGTITQLRVLPQLGQATAFEYVEGGQIIVGRRLSLTLQEV